jgi:hypothetical protein
MTTGFVMIVILDDTLFYDTAFCFCFAFDGWIPHYVLFILTHNYLLLCSNVCQS